jgi:hypothetical protein
MHATRYGIGYYDCCLLGSDAVVWYNTWLPAFQRNILLSRQGWNCFNWVSYVEEDEMYDLWNRTEKDEKWVSNWIMFLPSISALGSFRLSRIDVRFPFLTHVLLSVGFSVRLSLRLGRAIAQAVSRRLLTAAAQVQTRVWSCGILWWTKVALGQVFSENFGFPCQSTFYLLPHNRLYYHPRLAQ